MKNNRLDERQEQILLKIEHNGCWFAFWGLLAVIIIEAVVFGVDDFKPLAGEWSVFILLSCYISYASLKNGIWDRHLAPNPKTNMIVSLLTGLVVTAIGAIIVYKRCEKIAGSIASGVFMGVFAFVVCFIVLTASADSYKRQQRKIQEAEDEE